MALGNRSENYDALTAADGEQFNKLKNFKLANNLHAISPGIDLILFQVSCFLVNPPILPNELQRWDGALAFFVTHPTNTGLKLRVTPPALFLRLVVALV
jgi:hypothetical protein